MRAFRLSILVITLLSCVQSHAQHRIKMKNTTSLFVSIDLLAEDSVYFHFARQTKAYSISRERISQLQSLVWDPGLLEANFKLNNPYPFVNFQLADRVVLKKYLNYKGINYKRLDAKLLSLSEDTLRFITFLDTRYVNLKEPLSNIETINYSAQSKDFVLGAEKETSYVDQLTLANGSSMEVYIYELGYQGIKYSRESLPTYQSDYTGADVKTRGVKNMLFMPYTEIESITTYDGYRFVADYYAPVQSRKAAQLRPYPKAEMSLGAGVKWKLNNTTAIATRELSDGLTRVDTTINKLGYLYTPIDIKLWIHLPKNIAVTVGYDYSFSEEVKYEYNRFFGTGEAYLGDASYRTRLHTFRLGGAYTLGKIRIGASANTVLSRSPFTWQEVGYFNTVPQNGAKYEGFIKSTAYVRWGADIAYITRLGKVDVIPSVGYERFTIDFANTTKNVASRDSYVDQEQAYASETSGLQDFRQSFASSMLNWEVVRASVALSYRF